MLVAVLLVRSRPVKVLFLSRVGRAVLGLRNERDVVFSRHNLILDLNAVHSRSKASDCYEKGEKGVSIYLETLRSMISHGRTVR